MEATSGEVKFTAQRIASGPHKGGSCRFILGEGMDHLSGWMRLRAPGVPSVFRIVAREVMRFNEGGEIVIDGKARATSIEAVQCFAAWNLHGTRRLDADRVVAETTAGDPGMPNGDIEFCTFDGEVVVHLGDDGLFVHGKPATPEEVAKALIRWILGEGV